MLCSYSVPVCQVTGVFRLIRARLVSHTVTCRTRLPRERARCRVNRLLLCVSQQVARSVFASSRLGSPPSYPGGTFFLADSRCRHKPPHLSIRTGTGDSLYVLSSTKVPWRQQSQPLALDASCLGTRPSESHALRGDFRDRNNLRLAPGKSLVKRFSGACGKLD